MVPPAPGRFSMTMGCPSWGESLSVTVRAMMSVPLPGVNGTMILIGFAGHACACAPTCRAQSASAAIDLLSFPDILASRCLSDGTIWGKRNSDAPFRPTQRGGEYDGDPDD